MLKVQVLRVLKDKVWLGPQGGQGLKSPQEKVIQVQKDHKGLKVHKVKSKGQRVAEGSTETRSSRWLKVQVLREKGPKGQKVQ